MRVDYDQVPPSGGVGRGCQARRGGGVATLCDARTLGPGGGGEDPEVRCAVCLSCLCMGKSGGWGRERHRRA
jgi:hypothetical protein